jgi:hypothetical protein
MLDIRSKTLPIVWHIDSDLRGINELRVRLPRHHIDMLEYRADQQETTVSGVLARELDGIASAHIEELSSALPGFAEAMAWPCA